MHCNCHNLKLKEGVAVAIAHELEVALNDDYSVNESEYNKAKIREIDKRILELNETKRRLLND